MNGKRNLLDLFLIIVLFALVFLVPRLLKAEIVSKGRSGKVIGACAYYVAPDNAFMFAYCSEDNLIPGKEAVKYFEVITIGSSTIDNNLIRFQNTLSKKELSLNFESKKAQKIGNLTRVTYRVETPTIYTKLIFQKVPMAIKVKLNGTNYKLALSLKALNEMKMIASLQ